MRGNFTGGIVRAARLIVVVAAVPLTLSPVVYGQTSRQSSEPTSGQLLATRRCDSELNFIMARDNGGRNPDVAVDARGRTVRQGSGSQWELSGPGTYMRDSNDRGRPFTYTCRVDVQSGRVDARYQWSGTGGDTHMTSRIPDTRRPCKAPDRDTGRESRPGGPPGRVWASGGIIGRNSGKGLDVEGRSTKDAANVQQWEFGGGSNQLWDFVDLGRGQYAIVSQGSNKVIEVANSRGEDGTNIIQNHWNGGDNQRWRHRARGQRLLPDHQRPQRQVYRRRRQEDRERGQHPAVGLRRGHQSALENPAVDGWSAWSRADPDVNTPRTSGPLPTARSAWHARRTSG